MDPEVIPGTTQAIVPTDFLRQWRSWINRPHEKPRPGPLDNTWLLCKHGRLIIDPNVSKDLNTSISLVPLPEWAILQELSVLLVIFPTQPPDHRPGTTAGL